MQVRQLVVSGHDAVAIIGLGGTTIPVGKPFECTEIHTWTINSEGIVTNFTAYFSDTAAMIAARQP